MPDIQCLPAHVADLIAAGEVVERPASVAKELLENALDAGATAIAAEVHHGGLTYLRITDNGCGITPEQLPTAFLRHATSKLRQAQDLAAIGTLGFRGEALAAISAVSRVEIFSRQAGQDMGASLHLEGGVPGPVTEAGCPEGTTICVRDLFYNTPARMKFMKKDTAEATAVTGIVTHLALSHPEVSFKLLRDGVEVLHTPGDGQLRSAIYAAMGREFAMGLLPVEGRGGEVRVEGFVTKPLCGAGTRGKQLFFVNGRFVRNQMLSAAVEEAYRNRLLKGKFPGCVLHIQLPTELVDVNVHPAKTVVKFVNDKAVFDAVYYTIKDVLTAGEKPAEKPAQPARQESFYQTMTVQQYRSQTPPSREKGPIGSYTARPLPHPDEKLTVHDAAPAERAAAGAARPAASRPDSPEPVSRPVVLPAREEVRRPVAVITPGMGAAQAESDGAIPAEEPESGRFSPAAQPRQVLSASADPASGSAAVSIPEAAETQADAAEPEKKPLPAQNTIDLPLQASLTQQAAPWRIAGEVLRTYIICEDEEGTVWLIDKHAAHERLRFNALKAGLEPPMSQLLLTPLTVQLEADDYGAALEQLTLLEEFGFQCEDFGGGTLLVRQIPADIPVEEASATVEELCHQLSLGRADPNGSRDALLQTMACKSAIKAGMHSDERERRALVDKVQSGEIQYCPHGRPVAVKLTRYEIEKMFKRT